MKTIKHAIRKSYVEIVHYAIEDYINAELNDELNYYLPPYDDRNELAEAVWKDFIKYNPEGVRFMGKEPAMALIREWMAREDEAEIRAIVKNS